jgi:hypothetical protein
MRDKENDLAASRIDAFAAFNYGEDRGWRG